MMATIRTGVRLFKSLSRKLNPLKKSTLKHARRLKRSAKNRLKAFKQKVTGLFTQFTKHKHKPKPKHRVAVLITQKATRQKAKPIETPKPPTEPCSKQAIHSRAIKKQLSKKIYAEPKKQKLRRKKVVGSAGVTIVEKPQARTQKDLHQASIKDFYQEWARGFGPALTSLDRDFLEHAPPELATRVMANARLTLKSPYLKAVYNGLKDLEDISDLMAFDRMARNKVGPTFRDAYTKGPEHFCKIVSILHDKGLFETRSGTRMLSLDPRLIPEWLGLAM